MRRAMIRILALALGGACFLFLALTRVEAVPSFARQTGMSCSSCHTVFPELTPFGRHFKLTGYTISKSEKPYEFPPPLAGLLQVSFTNLKKTTPRGTEPFDSRGNDNVNFPQEVSAYYAGRIAYKLGAFVQGTYDGLSNKFLLDMTDIRFANTAKLGGKHLVYGLTINNSPTLEDVANSTPTFGFPYATSSVAPTPAAAAIVNGTLDQLVGGVGLYAYWNNLIYGGVTLYRTARNGFTQWLGAGTVTDMLVDGVAPYWRLFLHHQWEKHSFLFGTYGMAANIFPEGETRSTTDHFTDIALDAQYQYLGKKHLFSAATTWIHEFQDWEGSFRLGNATNRHHRLDTFKINLNYYYRSPYGTFGGNVAYFSTTGDSDPLLYSPDPLEGSRTGKPNSDGFILQGEYLPWEWSKIVVQYTIYNTFNGASTNYDGFERNASDNNTLYLLVWLMF